ncbi:hypothetical protein KVR01_012509 [Diaporthe batatas]|uniref:uncharacterized protein n=1 Tax=Diaporthe batatas TaxID=748121 RepID=UPI001D05859B|nr:uncharacterized protein KVR01_012509 [Diaporthe batatas]KAG8157847.1 hypothetical protein KVR01_012509 [Diaporthe batatas]
MMGGLNIMSQYTDYFQLTTATRSLNVATIYIGGCIACLFWGWITDKYGRRNRGTRKRLIITGTCALFSMVMGNTLVTYEIGKVLDHAGLTDPKQQLLINLGLNCCTLIVSIMGSFYTDRLGAKSAALVSTGGLTVSLFIIGALTKTYGETDYQPGIYASVAMIFVFTACFGFGWIPILFLIPAEMLNFSIRAWGMSMFSFVICVTGIWGNFAFLFALEIIGWKLYIINGAWNIGMFAFIAWYWVEVRGKTLEEIDALIDGKKHSDVPDLELVIRGTVDGRWKDKFAGCLTASCFREGDAHLQDR